MKELFKFQLEGVAFLVARTRAYLADSMGLGKTVQAAVAARQLGVKWTCVIAPASALENWRRDWHEWNGGWMLTFSYSSPLLRVGVIRAGTWDLVILDEAHYCKNPRAKRTLAALNLARSAPRAWLLSGTPMPNHPGELWAPIRALWPEIPRTLGITSGFKWFDHFTRWTQTRFGRRPYAVRNSADLAPHLKRIMLRRTLDDVEMELPPLRVDVSLLPKDAKFAMALEEMGIDPENLARRIDAIEADEEGSASRLRRLLGEYKAPHIGDLIANELDDGEYRKVVVLAYHHSVMDVLRKKLAPFGVVGFDGRTPQRKRQEAIDDFTTSPKARVFLSQMTAAGIAINLQAATEIVLVEPDWTPDVNLQAIKRIHRIGQDKPCRARIFAVAGSLDESVMRVVAAKTKMQAELGL